MATLNSHKLLGLYGFYVSIITFLVSAFDLSVRFQTQLDLFIYSQCDILYVSNRLCFKWIEKSTFHLLQYRAKLCTVCGSNM